MRTSLGNPCQRQTSGYWNYVEKKSFAYRKIFIRKYCPNSFKNYKKSSFPML